MMIVCEINTNFSVDLLVIKLWYTPCFSWILTPSVDYWNTFVTHFYHFQIYFISFLFKPLVSGFLQNLYRKVLLGPSFSQAFLKGISRNFNIAWRKFGSAYFLINESWKSVVLTKITDIKFLEHVQVCCSVATVYTS